MTPIAAAQLAGPSREPHNPFGDVAPDMTGEDPRDLAAALGQRTLLPAPGEPAQLCLTPQLLEYRADTNLDVHYIIRVTGSFAAGALAMGVVLNVAAMILLQGGLSGGEAVYSLIFRMAFVIGITGVASSLLLVGLKVRDDHTSENIFARHWLNAMATGAAFSVVVWGPWLVAERGVSFNRFVAAGIWMCLMALPGVAALWVVGPRRGGALGG